MAQNVEIMFHGKAPNCRDLCNLLGYEKGTPDRSPKILLSAIASFLDQFPLVVTPSKSRKQESAAEPRLYAMNFLLEENRGDNLWPPAADGLLAWDSDEHK